MTPKRRKRVRRAILFDAIFAIVFAIVMVSCAFLWGYFKCPAGVSI